jgi:hypothetical protein
LELGINSERRDGIEAGWIDDGLFASPLMGLATSVTVSEILEPGLIRVPGGAPGPGASGAFPAISGVSDDFPSAGANFREAGECTP